MKMLSDVEQRARKSRVKDIVTLLSGRTALARCRLRPSSRDLTASDATDDKLGAQVPLVRCEPPQMLLLFACHFFFLFLEDEEL